MAHVTNKLAGYLEGGLPHDERERVARHLESCARCRAALVDIRAAGHALSSAGRALPVPTEDGVPWSRVWAQIAPEAPRRVSPRWAFAGGTAVAAIALVAAAMFRPEPPPSVIVSKPKMMAKLPPATNPTAANPPSAARRHVRPEAIPNPLKPQPIGTPDHPLSMPGGPGTSGLKPMAGLEAEPTAKPQADARPEASPGVADRVPAPTPATPPPAPPTEGALHSSGGQMEGAGAPMALQHPAARAAMAAPRQATGHAGTSPSDADRSVVDPAASGKMLFYSTPETKASREDAGRLLSRAQSARALGNIEPATDGYEAALKAGLQPTQARQAHVALAELAEKAGDDRAAATHYAAAMDIAKDAPHLVRLGAVYERLHEPEKAAAAYRQALALAPNDARARAALARVGPHGKEGS